MNTHLPCQPGRTTVPLSRRSVAGLAIFLVLAATGCSGIPATTYCYQITGATIKVVDTGMTVAGDLYRAGHVNEATKAKLVAAHNVYRPAAQTAVAACRVVGSQGDADKVFYQLQKAADSLLETLVAIGVVR